MDLSVVIVGFHGWRDVSECVQALGDPAQYADIVVVDNAPNPKAAAAFGRRHPGVKVVSNEANLGFGSGCNLGVRHTSGQFLLFLNPDARADAETLEEMMICMEARAVGLLTVHLVDERGRAAKAGDVFPGPFTVLAPLRAAWRLVQPMRQDEHLIFPDWVTGAALMIRRNDFLDLDGFSGDFFMYSEDLDLCYRARARGLDAGIARTLTITHRHGGSSRASDDIAAQMRAEVVQSKHMFGARHYQGWRGWVFHINLAVARLLAPALLWPWRDRLRGKLRQRALMLPLLWPYTVRGFRTGGLDE